MSQWGNTPETWSAIATVVSAAGIVGVLFSWLALAESRTQRRALDREMAARMRPWIGLFEFGFVPANDPRESNSVKLLLRNFGALPAQKVKLDLSLEPTPRHEGEPDNKVRRQESGGKTLVPAEDGNYLIDLSKYAQFAQWRHERRNVAVAGVVTYALDERLFKTEFVASLSFAECTPAEDGNHRFQWRNQSVE